MNLDDLLSELKAEYLAKLPEKVSEIQRALQSNDYSVVEDIFHKLKGSGKTYGIPELSELGRVIENVCQKHANECHWVAPVASELIRKIQAARMTNQEYSLASDEAFQRIRALYQPESP